jgi:hypothetical protein
MAPRVAAFTGRRGTCHDRDPCCRWEGLSAASVQCRLPKPTGKPCKGLVSSGFVGLSVRFSAVFLPPRFLVIRSLEIRFSHQKQPTQPTDPEIPWHDWDVVVVLPQPTQPTQPTDPHPALLRAVSVGGPVRSASAGRNSCSARMPPPSPAPAVQAGRGQGGGGGRPGSCLDPQEVTLSRPPCAGWCRVPRGPEPGQLASQGRQGPQGTLRAVQC